MYSPVILQPSKAKPHLSAHYGNMSPLVFATGRLNISLPRDLDPHGKILPYLILRVMFYPEPVH